MATICKEVQDKIEEQVLQPVDDWLETTEMKCKEYPWWNPVGWFCWFVTVLVKITRWVLVPIIVFILRVVCEVVNFVANFIAVIINIILAIPIIGFIIRFIIRVVVTIINYLIGLIDGLGRLVGIRITKHLRVHVIPLCEGIIPLAREVHLAPIMRQTEQILYSRAQIRVHTTFHEPFRNPPEIALRLGTESDLIADELLIKGSWHQIQTAKIFESNLGSLISLSHPIIVYVIREVGYDGPGKVVGASGGPVTDWIAVERDTIIPEVALNIATGKANQPISPYPPIVESAEVVKPIENINYDSGKYVIAHEICHALGLLGHANSVSDDLMYDGNIKGDALSPFEVGIIRSSGHVTFV